MDSIKNIILNTDDEVLENIISPFIKEQFPIFMREDFGKLVLFVKSYYEWLEKKGNAGFVLSNMDTVWDTDKNAEEYYTHFKNTYLESFPELLATNIAGNKPNKNTLLKKIRDFYGNKGTESAYKFLFRILYDSDLEFYYPKTDVLKVSDGQWIEPRSVKTTNNNGTSLFNGKGGQLVQYSGSEVVASAFIDNVVQYSFNGYSISEFFITDINGTFLPNVPVKILNGSVDLIETSYSVLGEFFISVPGKNYRVGDIVTAVDSTGVGFSAKIEQTGLAGSVKKIGIINSGINYASNITVSIFNQFGEQTAVAVALQGAVTNYPGYFSGNSGKISSNKKIQDGHYYQEFSYELKSEVSFDVYADVLKKIIHPSGTKMFGSILVKKSLDNTLTSSSQGTISEVPLVGQYTPYALRTFNDLRNSYFLPNQVKGATLQVWLSGYNILKGNTSDGITTGWADLIGDAIVAETGTPIGSDDIRGIKNWVSLVGGHTFSHCSCYPNVWFTPNYKSNRVNTHSSIDFRSIPYRYIGGPTSVYMWVSLGFTGPTMGALGLSASSSYFIVAKPGRVSNTANQTVETFDGVTGSSFLTRDSGGYRGLWIGNTGGTLCLGTFTYNSGTYYGVTGSFGATGSWRLISTTYNKSGAGNSGPLSLFLDGVCLGTRLSALLESSSITSREYNIGMRSFDSFKGSFDGEIAEILSYQGDVDVVDRQKIEGYLAHKYDLVDNLPSTHPYKTTVPGGSFGSGQWYGATGDYYPLGYNPYIGSTAEVGVDGTTAPLGTLFFGSSLGYTYTVVNEMGTTAHSPIGSPLGSTSAWYRNKETFLVPGIIPGLVLWLKPENIGVCGSVVNGASVDVWRDASPNLNHAMPPTWNKWNGIAHITQTAAGGYFTESVRSTNPVTKLAFVANGLCGGFTHGRLFVMGLAANPDASNYYNNIDYAVYSYGSNNISYNIPRQYLVYESGTGRGGIVTGASNYSAYDNTVCEVEYIDPNIVYRVDGVVKRTVFAGYGRTFYFDSSFAATASSSDPKTSVTLLDLSYNGNPVVPNFVSTANIDARVYAGVTIDKLRPTLQTAAYGGITGVSFNGGLLFASNSTFGSTAGQTAGGVLGMGFTAQGSTLEKLLTGQHLYLTKQLKVTDDADIFVVYKPTTEGLSYGYGILGSRNTNTDPSVRWDSVLFHRSYNEVDRDPSKQTSEYYTILPTGAVSYPSVNLPPGLVGFRPQGDQLNTEQNYIAYDPHVSGVCFGVSVAELTRDSDNRIESFLNGDPAINRSRSTGRRIMAVSHPDDEDFAITKNMIINIDPGKTASLGMYKKQLDSNLLSNYKLVPAPINIMKHPQEIDWGRDNGTNQPALSPIFRVTQSVLTKPAEIATDEIFQFAPGLNGNIYVNNSTGAFWSLTLKSTAWTVSAYIRRADGAAITPNVYVYIYAFGTNTAFIGTSTSVGTNGWYKVSCTRVAGVGGAGTVETNIILAGFTNLITGVDYQIAGMQVLPYNTGDFNGTGSRVSTSYPTGFFKHGSITANSIENRVHPWGQTQLVWRGLNHSVNNTDASYNSNGGFGTSQISIDKTKLYRYSVWAKWVTTGTGRVYYGIDSNVYPVNKSDGNSNNNPYFTDSSISDSGFSGKVGDLIPNWVLMVGHVHPVGTPTGGNHEDSGWYVRSGNGITYSGLNSSSGPGVGDFIWQTASSTSGLRVFLYGSSTPNTEVQFFRPRIDLVDGNEPSISDLLTEIPDTLYDLSTSGNSMFVSNRPKYNNSYGGVLEFDGMGTVLRSNSAMNFGNSVNSTWEAWVNPSVTDGGLRGHNMYMGGGSTPFFSAPNNASNGVSSGVTINGVYKNFQSAGSMSGLGTNKWFHIVWVYKYNNEKTAATLYVNGIKSSLVVSEYVGTMNLSNLYFAIGNRLSPVDIQIGGNDFSFEGKIANARIYSKALTEAEVLQNFNVFRSRFGV